MPRSLASFFENPVFLLERRHRPLWLYLIRSTFPAWLLALAVPGVTMAVMWAQGWLPLLGVGWVVPAMLVVWVLLSAYPAWVGGTVLVRWREAGLLDELRLTLLAREEIVRGLALAAGLRALFLFAVTVMGFAMTLGFLALWNWQQRGEFEVSGLILVVFLPALLLIFYGPFMLAPNVLFGIWAGLRWSDSALHRALLISTLVLGELILMNMCGLLYLGIKGWMAWRLWREAVRLTQG
ncbi:MAG: hypothetical protein Kow0059_05580 [Candidatus Sumerlaeia bacterium]